jgi:hypothetical protein
LASEIQKGLASTFQTVECRGKNFAIETSATIKETARDYG